MLTAFHGKSFAKDEGGKAVRRLKKEGLREQFIRTRPSVLRVRSFNALAPSRKALRTEAKASVAPCA